MTPQRRFSQLTSAGFDPYNKSEPGRSHVWLYQRHAERWAPEFDAAPYIRYVREMQADCERWLKRHTDQLLNPGYDPYNHCNGARITFTFTIPQQTRKS